MTTDSRTLAKRPYELTTKDIAETYEILAEEELEAELESAQEQNSP